MWFIVLLRVRSSAPVSFLELLLKTTEDMIESKAALPGGCILYQSSSLRYLGHTLLAGVRLKDPAPLTLLELGPGWAMIEDEALGPGTRWYCCDCSLFLFNVQTSDS
jgi:hypothetical protein